MNLIRRSVLFVFLSSPLVWGDGGAAPVLSLGECVERALSANAGLTLAQDELSITQARKRTATAGLVPAITAKADQTRGKADNSGDENQDFLERSYGIQATQPLYAGGKLWGTRRQAALAAEVAALQLEKQRLDVRYAVTEAYWRVAALQRAQTVHRETYKTLQEDLEKAVRHDLSEARTARIELLSTRAQNRESEAALAEIEENLMEARIALLDAVGQRTSMDFSVPEEIPVGSVTPNEEEALKIARAHRPDLRIADRMIESAQAGRVIGRSGYYPKVDLNGFYGHSGAAFIQSEPFEYKRDWNAGVTAVWALGGNTAKYSAFQEQTSPKLGESSRTHTESQGVSLSLGDALGVGVTNKESRKAYHEEEWRYEKARRDQETEVHLAIQRLATAGRRRDAAKAKVDEAQQEFKDTRSLLQDDRAHLGDLASVKNRLAFAQAGLAQAQAQYLISVSALNRAVGVADQYRVAP
ncbi:MAG: TolC family protein [Elusimicrobia bacterium]|nr:TolC family protein [Elusimicrobiota bacterium]